MAVAAASHFVTYDFATTSILKAESRARKLVGMQAGRTGYQVPTRPVLNDKGETTPRALIEWSQVGLGQLKIALLESGDPYLELWADSAQPIKLSEHSSELLDKSWHLRDERLGRASWKTASRQEWMVIVTNKINKAIRRLPMLECIFRDQLQASAALTLARNYEALGGTVYAHH